MSTIWISVIALAITLISASVIDKRISGTVCHNSYQCSSSAQCCRDINGHVVTDQQMGIFGPPVVHQSGSCSSMLGKLNDICDNHCGCQSGLECYRPVSGVCCPPMKCYNATWVQHQKAYWQKCLSDPHCGLPP